MAETSQVKSKVRRSTGMGRPTAVPRGSSLSPFRGDEIAAVLSIAIASNEAAVTERALTSSCLAARRMVEVEQLLAGLAYLMAQLSGVDGAVE